ncbi:1-phosphofructokinase family hexose kinase [uncultured Moraxella sp.]|uniref:1-phosphofructokinase family hexose kinase n=1 Tax=uncultured Moraxella sp. TaxID=263769 RepID=UPI0025DC6F2E|nr:1-phosphofructokinase family hexose kinase [uncultured Moraxella sp.]
MKSVLCITLNPAIDMTISVNGLAVGEVNRATASQVDAAGKALNSAQVLADLGIETVAAGFLGADNAQVFERLFADRDAKIAKSATSAARLTDAFVRVAGETRTNVKLVDHGVTTDINGKGFVVSAADKVALLEQVTALADKVDAVLVAGSLPQGFTPMDFDQLLGALTTICPKVAVDVSGDALKIALKHPLWLIKPNNDELTEAFGVPCETLDEQRALFERLDVNIEHIVISMGAKGVHWLSGNQTYQALPPSMTVASTVGAGDTLVSGMIYGLLMAQDAKMILRQAVALSAYAVSIVGFGIPDQQTLDALQAQVQIFPN